MIKHLRVNDSLDHAFNLVNTYLFVEGRYQRGRVKQNLQRRGYTFSVLFTGEAINNYVVHRGEHSDDSDTRFRQRLLIIEINELPKK